VEVLPYLLEAGYVLKPDRKTKQPSAGKSSLEPYANRGDELCKNIIEYRHCTTTLGLLLRPLENLCTEGDAVMRPTVYTLEAKTGRMSCVRPNGQQFSRQGGIRACVRCAPGYLGISADFSGCEILVAAALSGDRDLYDAETGPRCHRCGEFAYDDSEWQPCSCGFEIKDGRQALKAHKGLHWLTAHTAFGEGATKENRYQAKRGTFTRLFGGGPPTAADQVGCEVAVMHQLFEAFNQVAPVFTSWDQWLRHSYKQGSRVWRDYSTGTNWVQDIDGRNRMIYQTYSGRPVYITNGEHAAGNGAIQGTARELLVDGLLTWKGTQWGQVPVLPVHDQLVAVVKEGEAAAATTELARCMSTKVLSSPGFEVSIGVDVDEPFVSWPDSS
jgi:DNA polymerase I-like protein with 3'-5' exonuclease and polymerase domains